MHCTRLNEYLLTLRSARGTPLAPSATWLRQVLLHPAFWMLFLVAITVNPCWYLLNQWIPNYMHDQRGGWGADQIGRWIGATIHEATLLQAGSDLTAIREKVGELIAAQDYMIRYAEVTLKR